MNLTKLFKAQRKLDAHIEKAKGLEGVDLIDKKILALQVELGELANEYKGFKFWSENQEPNVLSYKCSECGFTSIENIDCPLADEHYEFCMIGFNPLLEEYVDFLHFLISIGNDLNIDLDDELYIEGDYTKPTTEATFIKLFRVTAELRSCIKFYDRKDTLNYYNITFSIFVGLGEKQLGFTWQEIEQAYFEKNQVNFERQANGY